MKMLKSKNMACPCPNSCPHSILYFDNKVSCQPMSFIKVRLTIPSLSEVPINPSIQDKDTSLSCKPKPFTMSKLIHPLTRINPFSQEKNHSQTSALTSQNFCKPTKLQSAKRQYTGQVRYIKNLKIPLSYIFSFSFLLNTKYYRPAG